MDRSASAAFLVELAKTKSQPFHLFELQLDSGTIYTTDAARDIVFNGNTYPAVSHFLEFSGIRETAELGVSNCTVVLSGVDQTLVSTVLTEDYLDRRLKIHRGYIAESDPHLSLPGVAGNYASTPDSAANSITGDIDVRVQVAMNDWTPSDFQVLVSKWQLTGNQRSYYFQINPDGSLSLVWSEDGIAPLTATSTAQTGFADGLNRFVRASLVVNNGSGGHDVRFYTSTDGLVWGQLGSTITNAGVTSVFDGSPNLEVGSILAGAVYSVAGKVGSAQVYNGINGALAADFNPADAAPGASSFTSAATREVWTINKTAEGSPPIVPAKIVAGGGQTVIDPIAIFDGRCDEPSISENPDDGSCSVAIEAASHFVDFERRPGRHTNHEEQQIYFPGDLFFNRVAELDRQIIWGRPSPNTTAAQGGSGADSGSDGGGRFPSELGEAGSGGSYGNFDGVGVD